MTSPLVSAPGFSGGRPTTKPPQSVFTTPQVNASKQNLDGVSSTIVAPQGESRKTRTSVATPQPAPDNGNSLPDLTSSEPEASPSLVVRKITRRHKEALVVMSDTEAEVPSKLAPKEVRKSLSKQDVKTATNLLDIQAYAGMT